MKTNRFGLKYWILSLLLTAGCFGDEPVPAPSPRPPANGARPEPKFLEDDPHRPVERIAKELGVTPEQFRAAFKKVHLAHRGERPTEAQREANREILAKALGVSPEKLDNVMDKYRPEGKGKDWGVKP